MDTLIIFKPVQKYLFIVKEAIHPTILQILAMNIPNACNNWMVFGNIQATNYSAIVLQKLLIRKYNNPNQGNDIRSFKLKLQHLTLQS